VFGNIEVQRMAAKSAEARGWIAKGHVPASWK